MKRNKMKEKARQKNVVNKVERRGRKDGKLTAAQTQMGTLPNGLLLWQE